VRQQEIRLLRQGTGARKGDTIMCVAKAIAITEYRVDVKVAFVIHAT
jgi:hypothetical protein